MKNKRVFGTMAAAGCVLFAASAMGAVSTNRVESFEGKAGAIAGLNGWLGSGTATALNPGYDLSVGYPLAGETHSTVLSVEGTVSNVLSTATTENSPVTVDMMVQIALPDDELGFPSSVTATNEIQIAVGVATNSSNAAKGDLKVWCKNKSNVVGWYSLDKTLDKDSWHRVSFTFDYGNQLCQVRVDGEPASTVNGILKAGSSIDGAWYKLAASTSKSQLKSIEVVGSTGIDDMLVTTADTVDEAAPVIADADSTTTPSSGSGAGTGIDVKNDWIEKQGITRAAVLANENAPDGSGMKITQKYAAGFDVDDGKKFELKSMNLNEGNVVFNFNQANVPSGYKYVVETADNPAFTSPTSTDVTSGEAAAGSKSISMGETTIKYYRIKVKKTE